MSALNPMRQVRASCQIVCDKAEHVSICNTAIHNLALSVATENSSVLMKYVEWDTDNWHYSADSLLEGPLTLVPTKYFF